MFSKNKFNEERAKLRAENLSLQNQLKIANADRHKLMKDRDLIYARYQQSLEAYNYLVFRTTVLEAKLDGVTELGALKKYVDEVIEELREASAYPQGGDE